MPHYRYQRLSNASARLLEQETSRVFGHVSSTLIFGPGPLGRPDGGVDFEAIRHEIEARLHLVPQLRRKLRRIPLEGHPVWVDDREFNLDYHVRHTSLARPGTGDQLHRLVARIQSQRLDRSRPLWECWVLEGLEHGRFALLTKTHNALAEPEGEASDLLQALLCAEPRGRSEPGPAFRARPMPSAAELVRDEVLRRASLARGFVQWLRSNLVGSEHLEEELRARANRLARLLGYSLRETRETPFNGEIGPHRRFDRLVTSLDDARAVRAALGGSVHDVILATLAGAAGRYLRAHHVHPATLDFRVAVPIGLRDRAERGVAEWLLDLPVWETDPLRRLGAVRERTETLQGSRPGADARDQSAAEGWSPSRRLSLAVRGLSPRAPVSLRVVNVPGPQVPFYLAGARLEECYGGVPLSDGAGLAVSILSYDGKLCWGLNADFDLVPDLPLFTAAIAESFDELRRAAAREAMPLRAVPS
jgi:diacylglycerol O-acyltransferase / wax synthase